MPCQIAQSRRAGGERTSHRQSFSCRSLSCVVLCYVPVSWLRRTAYGAEHRGPTCRLSEAPQWAAAAQRPRCRWQRRDAGSATWSWKVKLSTCIDARYQTALTGCSAGLAIRQGSQRDGCTAFGPGTASGSACRSPVGCAEVLPWLRALWQPRKCQIPTPLNATDVCKIMT